MTTSGHRLDIPTADGTMDAYTICPAQGGPFPLVILLMDIWGLREELFAMAHKVAGQGYYCIVPNLFYRAGQKSYLRRNAAGKMVSFDSLPIEVQNEMQALGRGIDRAMVHTDIGALLAFCRDEAVTDGPAGVAGFCLGGRIAFLAAQEFPERIRATASLHGVFLVTDVADSPHRFAARMRGEVYCGHAQHDRFSAPDVLAALAQAFDGLPDVTYRQRLHAGAHHGYSLPDRDIHDAAASDADWREIAAMFRRQLKNAT